MVSSMWKFLLGGLLVWLFYNQTIVRRGYYIVVREINHTAEKTREFKPLDGVAPKLKTAVEVAEPTLDQMESLGFKVER